MTKNVVLLSLFFLYLYSPIIYANTIIPNPEASNSKENSFRVFYKMGTINAMFSLLKKSNDIQGDGQIITLGGKYRIHTNFKIGAYYQMSKGLRHDDDWNIIDNSWQWRDTSKRKEDQFILEIIPRALFEFLPGERWVGELRTRFIHNQYNSHNTVKIRPGLTYYWFSEGTPFINLYFQQEFYLPMNYGAGGVYQRWSYIGGLYHLSESVKLSSYLAWGSQTWNNTDQFNRKTDQTYQITEENQTFGLGLILKFD